MTYYNLYGINNIELRPLGQAVKTPPSQGGIMGSIPVGVTKNKEKSSNTNSYKGYCFFLLCTSDNNAFDISFLLLIIMLIVFSLSFHLLTYDVPKYIKVSIPELQI